ncbi:FtsX-like permease family protein [Hanamia caeni]|jgi:putative ABC transport system permease protein|uniref:FtsX-like permease family protein n=1 Tax=Hanamia caeni TaxID=2294116 RepID=A0A3M9NL83_9BACT|nr:ABC transporter permease [Hanamia caeni]RNI37953.1 FtsX-like permease family protein [Hanamia caeni]
MKLKDSLSLAFRTIRSNKLRTGITVAIIAFGIMALIGIITAIASMNQSLTENFATMGANSFSIRYRDFQIRMGGNREVKKTNTRNLKTKKSNERKIITYQEARMFKRQYSFPARVSISLPGPQSIIVMNTKVKTNPNNSMIGGDENYLLQNGYTLAGGRNLNTLDVESGRSVCILGNSVAQKLYGENTLKALDQTIKSDGIKYRVIGVLKDKGSSAFFNADNIVLTSYNNIRRLFPTDGLSYNIGVMVNNINQMDAAIAEAKGTFRPIRKLAIDEENNFYIDKSDSIAEVFKSALGSITTAAAFIGLITLIGAAIGLMNIMLVAVSERTREIGLIKAVGGKRKNIKAQFLFESIFISLIGAVLGIILGVIVGNVVGLFLHTGFVVPWGWVIIGIVVCSAVGLFAGLYPALKAARLDPIVALRYE